MSFAFPEVRQYKLAILKELLRNYPIDGLFLDWIRTGDVRDNPQTDAAGVANSGYEQPLIESFKAAFSLDPREISSGDERWVRWRAKPQTEFMRAVRKLVHSQKRDVPIAVMVECSSLALCRGLLDQDRWQPARLAVGCQYVGARRL